MKNARIAGRYAKALFDLALEMNIVEEVRTDMETMQNVCSASPDFCAVLKSPVIQPAKKLSIFRQLFQTRFHTVTISFLSILLKKRREVIINEIARAYQEIYDSYKNIRRVTVTTAIKAETATLDTIAGMLAKQMNANIRIHNQVDPEIIGGLVVSVDDRQFDASVRKQINRLVREFNINIYEQQF